MGTDKSFMDALSENMQVEGAQKNIIDHLNAYGQRLRQENPNASDDELYAKLEEYRNSKEFEHFTHTQFKGGIGVYSGIEDLADAAVGDTRLEKDKDWTDSAAKIVGGALVGGPSGIPAKIVAAAAKRGVTNMLINNPISRTAIKAAELTTPVTIPYTAPNIIANAAVGTALDQGVRYAQGLDTAFNPKEDGAGTSTLVAGAYGFAGAAAFVAAMRGRQTAALAKNLENEATKVVQGSPRLREQVTGGSTSEPTVVSGREQKLNPESVIDESALGGTLERARQNAFDEGSPLLKHTAEARPDINWREAEAVFRQNTGPVLEDAAHQATDVAMHDLSLYVNAVLPQNKAAVEAGMIMSTVKSRYNRVEDALLTKIENYEASGKSLKGNKGYEKAVDDLQRLQNDKDASARLALPDTARSEVNKLAHVYETSKSEDIVRVREAHKKWADLVMHNEVLSNRMDGEYAAHLRRLDPYYTPLKNDPLGGAMGVERVRRIAVRSVKRAQTAPQDVGSALARESPIRQFKAEVPSKQANKKQETRITAAMHPIAAMREYTLDSYRSMAKEVTRAQFVEWLSKTKDGKVSEFVKNGYMQSVPNPRTGKHWTEAANVYGNADLVKLMNDDLHVPVWSGGKMRLYKFGDRELSLALRHDPVKISGLMQNAHTMSDWFKFFTTGAGNPVFAVKGALYNILMGMFLRRGDRAYGTLSYAIHRYLPKPVAHMVRALTGDFDPTVLLTAPYHTLASITEFMAWAGARKIADKLKTIPEFSAFRQTIGEVKFQAMVKRAVSIAAWTENLATLKMMRGGATHGIRSIDPIANVHKSYSMLGEMMPQSMRGAYSFYKGLLDSIYLGGSRPYYTQNHALLVKKWGSVDKIPKNEMTQLMHETRTIGGDMSLVAANETVRNIETILPYMVQAKLGAYNLFRGAFGSDTFYYVIPRLFVGASAIGMSFYWRTYWNEESRKEFWQRRPEYDRYRIIDIPTPQLLWAWSQGENPAYNRNLYYSITLPPDLVGVVAGAAAVMQEMGMFPQDATPRPIRYDIPNLIVNSMTPAMPPLLQALAAQSGMKFDPQSSEARGGNWIRSSGNQFRAGPQAESLTNLGQVSNSTALTMNALFGAMGSHLAASTDILLHAAKFETTPGQRPTLKSQADYIAGLRAATGALVERATAQMPDVPLLWQNQERYRVTTPAWQFVAENNNHIRSIVSTGNDAVGKASQRRQALATGAGGIPEQVLADETLIRVSQEVKAFQTGTGPLGKLRQQAIDLRSENRGIVSNYNLPQDEKQTMLNAKVKQQQDNMQQQHLAIKYLEQAIAGQYGQMLAPYLKGRSVSMATIDAMMRESFGAHAPPPEAAAAQE
jgi:hypothetical protein